MTWWLGALEVRQAAACLVLLKMLKKILAPHHQLLENTDIFCILRLTSPPNKKKLMVQHKKSNTLFQLSISSSVKTRFFIIYHK